MRAKKVKSNCIILTKDDLACIKSAFNKTKFTNKVKELCGEYVSSGLHRDVYVLKCNDNFVVKVERNMKNGDFANVCEWRNYINNKEWDWFEKWLSPCELISIDGRFLIQRRAYHKDKSEYPKKIPSMFTDTKYKNFGWIGKRFVCLDYSYIPFFIVKVGGKKMKKAKWWDPDRYY